MVTASVCGFIMKLAQKALFAFALITSSLSSWEGQAQTQAPRTLESTRRFLASFLLGQRVDTFDQILQARWLPPGGDLSASASECMLLLDAERGTNIAIDFREAEFARTIMGISLDTGITRFQGTRAVSPFNRGSVGIEFSSSRLRDRAYPAFEFMSRHCFGQSDTGY